MVKKGFFTNGNGVWHHFDFNFPFHIQFSHHSYLNQVHINNGKTGIFNIYIFKYREKLWINKLLRQIDLLLKEFYEKQKEKND